MKKILTIMISTMVLLASTISLSISAANGGETNEVQNTKAAATTIVTGVSALSASTIDTQVSTNSNEETTTTSTSTTSTEIETTTNSTAVSTSTDLGTTTSGIGTTIGTTETSTTVLTAGIGTTSFRSSKPHKDMPPVEIVIDGVKYIIFPNGETRIAPNQAGKATTTTSTVKSTTTAVISGAPKTGEGPEIGNFAAASCAAVLAVGLMIFGKKED